MNKFSILAALVFSFFVGSNVLASRQSEDLLIKVSNEVMANMHEKGLLDGLSESQISNLAVVTTVVLKDLERQSINNALNLTESNIDYNIWDDIKKGFKSALDWTKGAVKDAAKWSKKAAEDLIGYVKKYGPGFLDALRQVVIVAGPIAAPIVEGVIISQGGDPKSAAAAAAAINGLSKALDVTKDPHKLHILTTPKEKLSPEDQAEQKADIEQWTDMAVQMVAAQKRIAEAKKKKEQEQSSKEDEEHESETETES